MKKVYIETLGCEKNTVDAELIIGIMSSNGYAFTQNAHEADIIIVNTCAFINDAKEESIETVLEMGLFKKYGKCDKLIVSGCLSQRYADELEGTFEEVDSFIGVNDLKSILKAAEGSGSYISALSSEYEEYDSGRYHTGKPGSGYIRIADGCYSRCSFCAIPSIRGNYKSKKPENIIAEARSFAKNGVRELNLIAQETNYYGKDLFGESRLVELLEEMNKVDGIEWIRLLYQNPDILSDRLIDKIFELEHLMPYFDIPMQHADSGILKNMNRAGNAEKYLKLIEKVRSRGGGSCAVRSSFIVGFPGEGEAEFTKLRDFIEEASFDRMGIFIYSEEDGTAALDLELPKVEYEEAAGRMDELMQLQLDISQQRLSRFIGQEIDVMIENVSPDEILGRSRYDAPDVDGRVILSNDDYDVSEGEIVRAKIDHNNEHDLYGELLSDE